MKAKDVRVGDRNIDGSMVIGVYHGEKWCFVEYNDGEISTIDIDIDREVGYITKGKNREPMRGDMVHVRRLGDWEERIFLEKRSNGFICVTNEYEVSFRIGNTYSTCGWSRCKEFEQDLTQAKIEELEKTAEELQKQIQRLKGEI